MTNPFEKITKKDVLYIAGAIASLIALFVVFGRGKISLGSGTQSDASEIGTIPLTGNGGTGGPGYTNYNTGPLYPVPLMTPAEQETAAKGGCGCESFGCAGPSQLDDGSAYSNVNSLLAYYQNTNPYYEQLYKTQLQTYADYFATGQAYATGAGQLNIPSGTLH
jgi:hypothetical protein